MAKTTLFYCDGINCDARQEVGPNTLQTFRSVVLPVGDEQHRLDLCADCQVKARAATAKLLADMSKPKAESAVAGK
jgi:hypothetical protein